MPPLKDISKKLLQATSYLNMAGVAIGAIWLAMQSQWPVIGLGITAILFASMIIPLLLIPAGIFSHFMARAIAQQRKIFERLMLLGTLVMTLAFFVLWGVGIFEYVMHNIAPTALYAGLIWAAAVVMFPLCVWISADQDNVFMLSLVLVTQVGVAVMAAVYLWRLPLEPLWIFTGLLVGFVILQTLYEQLILKRK